MKSKSKEVETVATYYDRHDILKLIETDSQEFSLDEELRRDIVEGKRHRKLKNVSLRIDPALLNAARKIAATRAIPYQVLIREWLAQAIRRELKLS